MNHATCHLFVRFALGPLALPGLLDVLGRQPPHGGVVLVVGPELRGLTLAVEPRPRGPVGAVAVEVVAVGHEVPADVIGGSQALRSKLNSRKEAVVQTYRASRW